MKRGIFPGSALPVELMITQSGKRNSIESQMGPPSDMQLRTTLTSCSVSNRRNGKFHSRNGDKGGWKTRGSLKNVEKPRRRLWQLGITHFQRYGNHESRRGCCLGDRPHY